MNPVTSLTSTPTSGTWEKAKPMSNEQETKAGQSNYAKKKRGELKPGPAGRASWFIRCGLAADEAKRFSNPELKPLKL